MEESDWTDGINWQANRYPQYMSVGKIDTLSVGETSRSFYAHFWCLFEKKIILLIPVFRNFLVFRKSN